ncbi:MAG: right-handed parallel beta-helix repeat-containing protein [Myxococcota bacterium]
MNRICIVVCCAASACGEGVLETPWPGSPGEIEEPAVDDSTPLADPPPHETPASSSDEPDASEWPSRDDGSNTSETPELPDALEPLTVAVSASSDDGNVAENVLDGDLATRWSAEGVGQYLELIWGTERAVSALRIAFFRGDSRSAAVEIQAIGEDEALSLPFPYTSSGTSLEPEETGFRAGRIVGVRLVGLGNSDNAWNSITEVEIGFAPVDSVEDVEPPPVAGPPAETPPNEGGITIASADELMDALAGATGGETFNLAPGYYGELRLVGSYPDYVTLRSPLPHAAVFGEVVLDNCAYVALEGIKLEDAGLRSERQDRAPEHVRIDGVLIENGGAFFYDVSDLTFVNSEVHGHHHGVFFNHVKNFVFAHNYIHDVVEDLFRFVGDSSNGRVENNSLINTLPFRYEDGTYTHSDAIQSFAANGASPRNIVIRGNLIYDDPSDNRDGIMMQGVFLSDAQYRDVVIEQNLIQVGTPNSIYMNQGAKDVVIRHNTLAPWPGGGGGVIRLARKGGDNGNAGVSVFGNVALRVSNETGRASVFNNYLYTIGEMDGLFSDPNPAEDWAGYLPVINSAIDFGSSYGAQVRLNELQPP